MKRTTRDNIDNDRPWISKSYKDKEYADIQYIGTNVTDAKKLTNAEKINLRQQIKKEFPKAIIDVMEYDCLDQGADGACMIAATFNLLNLVRKNDLHPKTRKKNKTWAQIKSPKYWTPIYNKAVVNTGAGDFDELLNQTSIPVIKNMLKDSSFTYKAIVGKKRSERYMNKELFKGKDMSDSNNLIRYIREFFEKLIDRKIPVAISWNGHARVIVGYNETQLLFADSWGNNWQQVTNMTRELKDVKDYFRAGFSTINKKNVFANVRDCIYFESLQDYVLDTMNEIQKRMPNLKIANLEVVEKKKAPKKKKKAPKKKKKGKMTALEKYKDKVELEIEEMKQLLEDSAEQREKSITDSLIGRGKPEEPQRTSINRALQACVCVESNGSGSIVTHNNETFVLTNQHVALKKGTIKFIMWIDGKIGYAETYWVDKRRDIGKMRIIEKPIDKVISSLSIHTKNVKKGQLLVQIHNPYHWEKDRTEIMAHFPFTVETRNIFPGTKNDEFSHSSTEASSVFGGSSGSPLIYRDPSTGILGGVVGIHKQWDPNQRKDKKYQGVLINDTTLRVLPKLKF